MGLPQRLPVTPSALKEHRRRVEFCRGWACLAELGRVFGTMASNELERRVDGREVRRNELGEAQWSRKYARYQRGSVPDDQTVLSARRAATKLGKDLQLERWRDLPLWKLVREPPPTLEAVRATMLTFPASIRVRLFHMELPDRLGRCVRREFRREQVLALRDEESLDAFCALIALAREGEILEDDPRHGLSARCAFELFPLVLLDHPQLQLKWETLFSVLELAIWSREYHGGIHFPDFTLENVRRGLALKTADRKTVLPWTAGVPRGA